MIDLTRINIRIGGRNSQYLNVDFDATEVGSFELSEGRIVNPQYRKGQPGFILDEVRRVIEPVVNAAGRS